MFETDSLLCGCRLFASEPNHLEFQYIGLMFCEMTTLSTDKINCNFQYIGLMLVWKREPSPG